MSTKIHFYNRTKDNLVNIFAKFRFRKYVLFRENFSFFQRKCQQLFSPTKSDIQANFFLNVRLRGKQHFRELIRGNPSLIHSKYTNWYLFTFSINVNPLLTFSSQFCTTNKIFKNEHKKKAENITYSTVRPGAKKSRESSAG